MLGEALFITGPMFSGKTSELLRIFSNYDVAKKRALIVKPFKDSRYGKDVVKTHEGFVITAKNIVSIKDVFPILSNAELAGLPIEAVFVDEAQFIEDLCKETIFLITETYKCNLYMSGLTLDSFREPFPNIIPVLPFVTIKQLTAVCSFCGSFNAVFTVRNSIDNSEQVFIGGIKEYSASCRSCFERLQENGKIHS